MNEKIVGYVMLVGGIIIMAIAMMQTYLAFTDKIEVPALFETPKPETSSSPLLSQLSRGSTVSLDINTLLGSLGGGAGNMDKMFNLSMYGFLMFLLLSFGYKIASLGVNMVRPINVKLNSMQLEQDNNKKPPPKPQ